MFFYINFSLCNEECLFFFRFIFYYLFSELAGKKTLEILVWLSRYLSISAIIYLFDHEVGVCDYLACVFVSNSILLFDKFKIDCVGKKKCCNKKRPKIVIKKSLVSLIV